MNQRLVLSFLSIFLLIAAAAPAKAFEIQCPRHKIETNLKGKLAKTRTFRGSSRAFTEYVMGHDRAGRILGFVNQNELYTRLKYDFEVKKMGGDQYCVMLRRVQGYFYAAPKLYLPSDYKKKSCEFQQIYKHEQRHLNAVYKFHERNTGKYAAYLGKIAREVPIPPPVSEREVGMIKKDIANYFEGKFRELEYESIMQLNREQAKIDSPQEYTGVSKRCSNW